MLDRKATTMTAEEMWKLSGLTGTYEAWPFGGAPDKLADLVIRGIKTATCSALILYEAENEKVPEAGDYSVILDSEGNAVCIIQTTLAYIAAYKDVTSDHAFKEGEGDRSLEYWRAVHEEFFTEELSSIGQSFGEDLQLVCEEFKVVFLPSKDNSPLA